jgi:wyosine [tRNA(Phe)-imidazoG37] synthetase (radical SAM superfamily)
MGYVFGPVPSRRLGRSLGVDVVPYKTCSYDCIYCQIGCTTCKTDVREEWIPLPVLLEEIREKLPTRPDYITIGGSGEPTLYARLGELIAGIKAMTDIPVAVLTNGSLLGRPEVREALLDADLVAPSLDAGNAIKFGRVNRPCAAVSFDAMLEGLIAFRRVFKGQYWLEILLVAGCTDTESDMLELAACAKRIGPDRVQLNTVTRPPAESFASAIPQARMNEFAHFFDPPAEVIAEYRGGAAKSATLASREAVLDMVLRHPCTVEDVADGLGISRDAAEIHLSALLEERKIITTPVCEKTYYLGKAGIDSRGMSV